MSLEHLHKLFVTAEVADCSDIHLTRDEPPYVRVGGRIVPTRDNVLTDAELRAMLEPTMSPAVRQRYDDRGYADFAYETELTVNGSAVRVRYRMHLYRSRGSMTAALRRIKLNILSFHQLLLPAVYEKAVTLRPKGILIIGGETGSGKSTTLAAMLDFINAHEHDHIVTIEDPIEYVLPNRRSKINQRELGEDFRDFPDALRAVVREDPDVILIGELRDGETVRAAIAAAETGHLVLTSLHTATAPEAVNRILYFFPPHEENAVRQNLSGTLIAIMNQMLLPALPDAVAKGAPKRVPATEVLINTPVVREFLRDPLKGHDLSAMIADPKAATLDGSHDFNFSLRKLVEKNLVGSDTAIGASMRPEQLRMSLRGIAV